MTKNYILGIDVQVRLLHDHILELGREYVCKLRMVRNDGTVPGGEYAYLQATELQRKNVVACRSLRRFDGEHLTATVRPDGSRLRLNLKSVPFDKPGFNVHDYADEVKRDIILALEGCSVN